MKSKLLSTTAGGVAEPSPPVSPSSSGLLDGEWIGRSALAKEFGVSVRTVVRWTYAPNGIPHMQLGIRTLYRRSSVRDWLAKREEHPGAPRTKRRAA
jgi:hypothetical protein